MLIPRFALAVLGLVLVPSVWAGITFNDNYTLAYGTITEGEQIHVGPSLEAGCPNTHRPNTTVTVSFEPSAILDRVHIRVDWVYDASWSVPPEDAGDLYDVLVGFGIIQPYEADLTYLEPVVEFEGEARDYCISDVYLSGESLDAVTDWRVEDEWDG